MVKALVGLLALVTLACGAPPPQAPPVGGPDAGEAGDAGDDGGAPDAGPLDAGAVDGGALAGDAGPPDAGAPNPLRFDVPPLTWAFVPLPETRCANGSTTGVGVNLNPASNEVLVYFVGGGACWNLATCGVGTSANVRRGYGAAEFAADGVKGWAMFSRQEPRNPFRELSLVVVPYCTADVHAGTQVKTYDGLLTVHHLGARNVDALLPRLVATFPSARRLVLVGSSAGGFGAQLNAPKFVAAFPAARVDVLADSAQLVNPAGPRLAEWVAAWGVQVPAACAGCANDFPRFLDHLLATYPGARFGLLASMQDTTLTPFFNYGLDVLGFATATSGVLARYDGTTNGTYFARTSPRHTWLEFVTRVSGNDDTATFDWVQGFLRGDLDRRRP
ncbi:MAG: hypothetical protein INH41_26485 [Myxococcaceae bacterium]|nr:hypothetical protein [Myxococcaceae bacterium]MCA3015947.1 hypothetical protein [Myxococcaceae bacterium]